jgi:hypothetical protein
MKSTRCFALGSVIAALIVCGLALDKAHAQQFCGNRVLGCANLACIGVPGNCPNGNPYTFAAQQAFGYVPCTAPAGLICPNPLNNNQVCFSGGYTPLAGQNCGNLVCGNWTVVAGC